MMQLWAIAVDSFRESRERKIFWVLMGITGFVVLAMLSVGFEEDRVVFVFGMFETSTDFYDPASDMGKMHIVSIMVYVLIPVILGWIGVILMIIATANVFPSLMEPGTIDVILSKPIGRPKLFLCKYASSMIFVFVQAAVFVCATFLVMGLRWGVWTPGYLLAIPLLVLLFSYVYCVSVLVGVKTRSPVAAILISLGAWVVFAAPAGALDVIETHRLLDREDQLYRMIQVASWIPPKVSHVPFLAARWAGGGLSLDMMPEETMMASGELSKEQFERAREREQSQFRASPVLSIGSSLLFEAVVVMLAMWHFVRRDF